ncbi:MAG: response regulator transcription factor [Rhodocyclaceae bacterium]|nr:response regulator transcription factor [Rhodocyclaceae bacterium]MBX3667852.1 response regulator transcription factor [Rhodocyclaceae bacterium]
MAKLLVVEDHTLVREGMLQTLRRLGSSWYVLEAFDANSALSTLSDDPDIDLIILDLMLPGMSGFALLAHMRKNYPLVPVVVVSGLYDGASVARALRQGASGYVPKASSGEKLLDAVRVVMSGGLYSPNAEPRQRVPLVRTRTPRAQSAESLYGLRPAQVRVLEFLAKGKTNREIGELLGLTEGTVKVHVSAIFRALKVSTRAQVMVVLARDKVKFD